MSKKMAVKKSGKGGKDCNAGAGGGKSMGKVKMPKAGR